MRAFISGLVLFLTLVGWGTSLYGQGIEIQQPPRPKPVITGQGKMVSFPDYHNLKNLWNGLANFNPKSKETLEARRKDTLAEVDQNLKALEEKALIGRWVRSFFESEFQNRFDQIGLTGNIIDQPSISDEDRIIRFWKEIDFCQEGFFSLDRFQEYDAWLNDLVKERTQKAFHLIRGVNFQKRLDHLKISREAYQKKLTQLLDSLVLYQQKAKAKSQPGLIGKGKSDITEILVRPPQGNWTQLTARKEKELYDTDLIEVQAKEDKKIILQDRRYIMLEAGAILAGWELNAQIPESLYKEIAQLIEQLGNDDWHLREAATEELINIGEPAVPAVKKAIKHKDPEIRMRANLILKKIETTPLEELEQRVREIVEPAVAQRQYSMELVTQLLELGEPDQIISILRKLENERSGDRQWRSVIQWFIAMIQRQRR